MDKFIIKLPKPEPKVSGWKPVSISIDTYNKIMDLKEQTGFPPNKIIALCVDFSLERLEIQESEE